MKNLISILLILSFTISFAQTSSQQPYIKTVEIIRDNQCVEFLQKDKRGNTVFQLKETNATTKTKALIAYQYDNLNRETLSLEAIESLDLIETVYEPDRI